MTLWSLLVAAVVLALERACYVGIARSPGAFRRLCARPWLARFGEPVAIVRKLFYGFKALQMSVFVGWCWVHQQGSSAPPDNSAAALVIGGVLIVAGQLLNGSVFYRLGSAGVFYGNILGHEVPWCRDFPFSVLSHPQYVGTVLSIWGFFLAVRFPNDAWSLLPALETVYYIVGARLEDGGVRAALRLPAPGAPDRAGEPSSDPAPAPTLAAGAAIRARPSEATDTSRHPAGWPSTPLPERPRIQYGAIGRSSGR